MDDRTKRYLSLQRRLMDDGIDADYVELALHRHAEDVEGEVSLDSLADVIEKEVPERFRSSTASTDDDETADDDETGQAEHWEDVRRRAEEDQKQLADEGRGLTSVADIKRRMMG